MNHLTDEQMLEWLEGESSRETSSHLEDCAQCRAEAEALRLSITRYSIALRNRVADAHSAHMARNFDLRHALLQHRLRWAGAAVLVLLLTVPSAWMLRPRPSEPVARPIAVVSRPLPATTTNGSNMSDDELLEAVNNDLDQDVPQALAPVSAITDERNRIAAKTAQADGLNTRSEKQGEVR